MSLALSSSASASVPVELGSFTCSVGTPCGADTTPNFNQVAVDEETGDVYVTDRSAQHVDRFTAEGVYDNLQLAGVAFGFGEEGGVCDDLAVDNSGGPSQGNIYVNSLHSVFAFDSGGNLLWKQEGFPEEACGIGVDYAGHVWLSMYNVGARELKLTPPNQGEQIGEPLPLGPQDGRIAFDSANDFLQMAFSGGEITKYEPNGAKLPTKYIGTESQRDVTVDRVTGRVYSATEEGAWAWDGSGTTVPGSPFGSGSNKGVAVNAKGHKLYLSAAGEVAIFEIPLERILTVSTTGPGRGSIFCDGGPCGSSYNKDQEITLSAGPQPGSFFAGWKVDGNPATCPGVGSCTFKLEADSTVEADFEQVQHTLSVNAEGTGSGTVAIEPFGIACETLCVDEYPEGEYIVLMASPHAHSRFVGWSDACSGTATYCEIESLDGDTEVTANFGPAQQPLSLSMSGSGSGTVSCDTGSGPEACAAEYPDGTSLTLSASAAVDSSFAGWGGACSGSGTCELTFDGPKSVEAIFDRKPAIPATQPPAANPTPTPAPTPKPLKCRRGKKKVVVRGKARCTNPNRHRKHRQRSGKQGSR
jgi:Divergent InlB B-repeat domain